jgi:hypothetical protein
MWIPPLVTRLSPGRLSSGLQQPTLAAEETTEEARDRVGPRAGNPNHRSCRRVILDQRIRGGRQILKTAEIAPTHVHLRNVVTPRQNTLGDSSQVDFNVFVPR